MRPFLRNTLSGIFILLLVSFTLTGMCEKINGTPCETRHIKEEFVSPFFHLDIDADVVDVPVGTVLTTYVSDYAEAEKSAWLEMFFGDKNADVQADFESMNQEELARYGVSDPEREKYYQSGNRFTRYQSRLCALTYRATKKEIMIDEDNAKENTQGEGLSTTTEEAAAIAHEWIDQLADLVGFDGYTLSKCMAMPKGNPAFADNLDHWIPNACYLVEYKHDVGALPVSYDRLPQSDVEGDMLQIFIDDSGVLLVRGTCREYTPYGSATVNISLEKALEILEENMDYVIAYPDEGKDGFSINEISLCWRLVPLFSTDDPEYCVKMETRPVWRFASDICRMQTNVYVMYIDAETGEVVP